MLHGHEKSQKYVSTFEGYNISKFDIEEKLINLSPGPTQIPDEVLNNIKDDTFSSKKYGATAFEISHRSPEFKSILDRVNENLRNLLKIPDDFSIIWTQAGGHGQFSSIPLNMSILLQDNKKGNYVVTGTWSERSFKESCKFIKSYNSLSEINRDELSLKFNDIPGPININEDDCYVYICSNETVNGLEFREDGIPLPNRDIMKGAKLMVDMSSDLCMKVINWDKIDAAFACTSKNLGVAGANVLIIKKSLLEEIDSNKKVPCILDWNLYNKTESLYNTPAIFNIYMIDHMLKYYLQKGGIEFLENLSKEKAKLVYNFIDNSILFSCVVEDENVRSNINIPFIVGNGGDDIRSDFLEYCYKNNIVGMRTKTPFNYKENNMIEPLRISLYNGISLEDTIKLVSVMSSYEKVSLVI